MGEIFKKEERAVLEQGASVRQNIKREKEKARKKEREREQNMQGKLDSLSNSGGKIRRELPDEHIKKCRGGNKVRTKEKTGEEILRQTETGENQTDAIAKANGCVQVNFRATCKRDYPELSNGTNKHVPCVLYLWE